MEKYFMYVRKSTEPNDRQKLSIPAQIREIQNRFPDLTCEVLEEHHSAFLPEARPVFNEMIRRLGAGDARGIVCWHPDRLSRNEIDGAKITYQVRKGLDLKFANYTFEPSAEGIMMLQMALSQSQYSSAKLSLDVRRGNREKLEQGGITWVPGPGYRNNQKTKKIEPDPQRFHLVEKMFDLAIYSRLSPPKILRIANEDWGFRTIRLGATRGGKKLASSSIYRMFRSPFYAGFHIGKSGRRYGCNHKAMITEDEYWQLQKILDSGQTTKPRTRYTPFAAGLIKCGECGCSITIDRKQKTLKSGKVLTWEYYRCTKKRGPCSQSYLELRSLETQVIDFLDELTLPQEFYKWASENQELLESAPASEHSEKLDSVTRTADEIEKELKNLVLMRRKDFIDDNAFIQQRSVLESEQAMLMARTTAKPDVWLEPLERLKEFNSRSQFWFKNGPLDMKRAILVAVGGSNLVLHNKKLHIRPVGPFEFCSKEVRCAVWQSLADNIRTYFIENPDWDVLSLEATQNASHETSETPQLLDSSA